MLWWKRSWLPLMPSMLTYNTRTFKTYDRGSWDEWEGEHYFGWDTTSWTLFSSARKLGSQWKKNKAGPYKILSLQWRLETRLCRAYTIRRKRGLGSLWKVVCASSLTEFQISLDSFCILKKWKLEVNISLKPAIHINWPNNQLTRSSIPFWVFLHSLPLSQKNCWI